MFIPEHCAEVFMKNIYEAPEMNIVAFETADDVTFLLSLSSWVDSSEDEGDNNLIGADKWD